jgi:DNA-directed RNA polymerase subunit beta
LANINNKRINFAQSKSSIPYPDFLEIQLKSFQEYFQLETTPDNRAQEGLFKVSVKISQLPIHEINFVLEFLDYFIDPPRYTILPSVSKEV